MTPVPVTRDPRVRATRPEIWFNAVSSLCPECGTRVNGKHHITTSAHVVMRQFCPEHGHRAVLVSTDVDWFSKYEQMAAVLPPRQDRSVPEGACCVPEVALEEPDRQRRLLWLRDASPGSVHLVARGAMDARALGKALEEARQAGHACVTVGLPAAALLEREIGPALEAAGAVAHVSSEDPQLAEVLERRPGLAVTLVTRLDRPHAEVAPVLAAAWRRVRESRSIVAWEVVPCGEPSSAWHKHDHHPSKGPEGKASNGPVPKPGPIAATLSEALPLVEAAARLTRDQFFPLLRFHPPGSALAVLRRGADGAPEPVNARLAPRERIDLVVGKVPAESKDPAVLATRALFGHGGRMHPRMFSALVAQGLGEPGALVAEDHRAGDQAAGGSDPAVQDWRNVGVDGGPPAARPALRAGSGQQGAATPAVALVVHHPLVRAAFDRTRLLRACPVPREQREECNDACRYRAR